VIVSVIRETQYIIIVVGLATDQIFGTARIASIVVLINLVWCPTNSRMNMVHGAETCEREFVRLWLLQLR